MLQQINQSSAAANLALISGAGAHPVLRLGAKGAAVVELQKKLAAKGFSPGAADGDFGPKTLAAVKAFQKSRHLVADGVVGPKTWAALGVTGGGGGHTNPYRAQFERALAKLHLPKSWATSEGLWQIVNHESSWNPRAKNPSSTAFGLFQLLKGTWKQYCPEFPYGSTDPYAQALGGLRYIKARYGTPEKAWAFWKAHHWY
jgi:peptidoglycan hydrolase-like protein with peptidoglycan-binding domain